MTSLQLVFVFRCEWLRLQLQILPLQFVLILYMLVSPLAPSEAGGFSTKGRALRSPYFSSMAFQKLGRICSTPICR